MSRGPRDSSLFAPLSRGMCKTNRLQRTVKDEEEQLMADCYQDGEYSKLFLFHSLLRYSHIWGRVVVAEVLSCGTFCLLGWYTKGM